MTKKIALITGLSASAFFFAQDVSTIRNTSSFYDNHSTLGTARYSAMAGSMGALGGDISSINSNPAGLGVFITSDISGSFLTNSDNTTSTLNGESREQKINKSSLGQIGGVLALQTSETSSWKFVNLGVNFSTEKMDQNIESPRNHNIREPYYNNTSTTVPADYNLFSGHLYQRVGSRSKLNIGIGGNYNNKIYVGAAVNFHSTDLEQYDEILISSLNNPSLYGYYSKQNTLYREDGGGFSASAGIIGKISNEFRLGLSVESPTWYSIDREYQYYENQGTATAPVIKSYTAAENRKLRTPGKATLSGAFIANKNFAFNVDYRIDLGKPSFTGGEAENQLNEFYKQAYKAQNEVRIGGEFRHKGFRARAGYAFTTSPFKDYTYSASNPVFNNDATVSTTGNLSNYIVGKSQKISGGLGYDFKSFYVDAAYQYATYNYTNPFFGGVYVYNSANGDYSNSDTSIVSDVKTKRGNFILTLGWKF